MLRSFLLFASSVPSEENLEENMPGWPFKQSTSSPESSAKAVNPVTSRACSALIKAFS